MTSLSPIVRSTERLESGAALIVPVILSGGSGTRLWPVSRESFPKQFWPLVSDRTLLQSSALRATDVRFAPPIVICNHEHRFVVAEQLRAAGIEDARIVLEPTGRNTAPAIATAALLVAKDDPSAVLWVMSADSAMQRTETLSAAIDVAEAAARAGRIVLFGMQPASPETGYGYIERGDEIVEAPGAFGVSAFLEKPDAAVATKLIASGKHLWNAGMFVFMAKTMLAEMTEHAPEVLETVRRAMDAGSEDLNFTRLDPTTFAECPNISVDHAVAEHTSVAAVVPADFGWSDVGGWRALWELGEKDERGNVTVGDVMLETADNCYVRSDGIVTAVVGLEDAVVVVTKDAVLAMHKNRAQDVKKIVDRLKKAGRPEAVSHNRCYRPWGFYESLIQGDRFQVKRIVVEPGHKLSLQKHFHRAEHWVVVNGTAVVTRDHEEVLIRENESIYLPLGCVHRLENRGRIPLALIEVQSGAYLGEDDIIRIEDTYGRN
jgi:mannose-1-phosphate guanylyltransferase/mannose-6-phosphate isomerase